MKTFALGLGLFVSFAAGCGGADFDDTAASVEGIYRVNAYTYNAQACAPGGVSELGTDTYAVATRQEVFGTKFVSVLSCASPADCRAKLTALAEEQPFGSQFAFTLDRAGDDGTLRGTVANTGFSEDDGATCTDGALEATTLTFDGSLLRIENQITPANDYAAQDGFCTSDGAQAAAADNDCEKLEVFTADFVEAI
jgi:hypothetical protein